MNEGPNVSRPIVSQSISSTQASQLQKFENRLWTSIAGLANKNARTAAGAVAEKTQLAVAAGFSNCPPACSRCDKTLCLSAFSCFVHCQIAWPISCPNME